MEKIKQEYIYYVWARSNYHDTYSICHSYKDAIKQLKRMKATLFGDYKFSIEKEKK